MSWRLWLRVVALAGIAGVAPVPTVAQPSVPAAGAVSPSASRPTFRPGTWLVQAGVTWTGAQRGEDTAASLRSSVVGALTPPPFTLFSVTSSVDASPGADVSLGMALTRAVALEVVGATRRPRLSASVRGDVEGAAAVAARETLSEYTVGGALTALVPRVALGRSARPFVRVGGAYLRQLHAGRLLVDTGSIVHAGGGVRWWWRGARGTTRRSSGVAADVQWSWRMGGVALTGRDGARGVPAAALRIFVGL